MVIIVDKSIHCEELGELTTAQFKRPNNVPLLGPGQVAQLVGCRKDQMSPFTNTDICREEVTRDVFFFKAEIKIFWILWPFGLLQTICCSPLIKCSTFGRVGQALSGISWSSTLSTIAEGDQKRFSPAFLLTTLTSFAAIFMLDNWAWAAVVSPSNGACPVDCSGSSSLYGIMNTHSYSKSFFWPLLVHVSTIS